MERWTFSSQATDKPAGPGRRDNLYSPVFADGGERGRNWEGHTRGSSVYTKAMLHPAVTAGVFAAAVAIAGTAWQLYDVRRRQTKPNPNALEFGLS